MFVRRKTLVLALLLTSLINLYMSLLAGDDARDIPEKHLDLRQESQSNENAQNLTVKAEALEDKSQKIQKLPEIAVVGVKKCGTGALIEMLRMHPDIVAPPYEETEVKFWGQVDMFMKGLEYYKSLMPLAKQEQKIIVKIPGLAKTGNDRTLVRRQLHKALPGLKLLIIVRNPITRILSHIMHEFFNPGGMFEGQELPDLDDLIMGRIPNMPGPKNFSGGFHGHLFHMSDYSRIYQRYAKVFPKESIFVVNGDALIKQPVREIKKVEQFLGLRDFFTKDHFYFHAGNGGKFPCFTVPEMRCMDSDKGLPHPRLKKRTVRYMREILKPKMEEFMLETGVRLEL